MQNSAEVVYRLNERDEVCYVNPQYDAFAEANEGAHVESRVVLHRSLWDFVTDSTTQQLYRDAIRRARAGRRVRFRFRCDSPTSRRLMEMDVACVSAGCVEFRVRTLLQEPRTSQPLLDPRAKHTTDILRMCGWCKKVRVGNAWVEVEAAVEHLRLFEHSSLPLLTHGICDECYRAAMASLEDSDNASSRN